VLARYTTASDAANRKAYLRKTTSDIKERVETALNGWKGSYRSEFLQNGGTADGSSISTYLKGLIKSFEKAKNYKLAFPAKMGQGANQSGAILPDRVEARYSGKSMKLLKLHLKTIENIWYGKGWDGKDGAGFEEYLQNVEQGNNLISLTKTQFGVINTNIVRVPEQRLNATTLESQEFKDLVSSYQKMVGYFKRDLPSLTSISVTYKSGDGD
jgi:uncharacterized protein